MSDSEGFAIGWSEIIAAVTGAAISIAPLIIFRWLDLLGKRRNVRLMTRMEATHNLRLLETFQVAWMQLVREAAGNRPGALVKLPFPPFERTAWMSQIADAADSLSAHEIKTVYELSRFIDELRSYYDALQALDDRTEQRLAALTGRTGPTARLSASLLTGATIEESTKLAEDVQIALKAAIETARELSQIPELRPVWRDRLRLLKFYAAEMRRRLRASEPKAH